MNSIQRYKVQLVQEDNFPYSSTCCNNSEQTKQILRDILKVDNWHNEKFGIVCLSNQNYILGLHIITEGTINECSVFIREIALRALLNNCTNVILFHNHPGETLTPSPADIDLTRKTKQALALLNINVIDHIILTATDAVSMADMGIM